MPLPVDGIPWPPRIITDCIHDTPSIAWQMSAWSAWYSGNRDELETVYALNPELRNPSIPRDRPSQRRGGLVGIVSRFFWGQPRGDLTQTVKSKLHVPIAADLCSASAHLLFAEPPAITVDNAGTQDRIEELCGDGLHATLGEAAELAAALGSSYLRVTWDREIVPDGPFLTAVDADSAIPEFRWGRLVAVTFWRTLHNLDDNRVVWRHLERHELDTNGFGLVLHGLYMGTAENLGRAVPVDRHPETAGFMLPRDDQDQAQAGNVVLINTGTPGLAVEYMPNQRPQRLWRKHPLGANLGRSDLDGVEGFMDALDETYTSWMRDIRLGKARLIVGRALLEDAGNGNGATFDADQEIYSPVNMLPPRDGAGLPMEQVQFAIRVTEHQQTAQQLTRDIVRTAGYSAQTFGESGDSAATATEIQARQQRSFLTRDDKIRMLRPPLARIIEKLLRTDVAIFNTQGITPDRPHIEFADGVQDSALNLAQTAQALASASAASIETRVQMVHPDWDDTQVQAEVLRIQAENAIPDATLPGLTDPSADVG